MLSLDLRTLTITEASHLLQSRRLSPVELVQATLDRIATLNPKLNAFTTVTSEYALERAQQAEKEISRGNYLGPLHGIPYSLKDLIDTKGIRTTYGYRSHQDYVPQESATVHVRLERAGAVLVGKADSHFRRLVPVNCFNPWDLSRSPGISSSGSGAALAASLGLASIGSDTGGSVRIPAAWSGVVGLRATLGLISRHNALGSSWSVDQVGPLAKTVEDVAIVLQAIAGYDPNDPIILRDPVLDYRRDLHSGIKGVRVGVLEAFVGRYCTEEVETAVRQAIRVLQDLGAEVTEVAIPRLDDVRKAQEAITGPESFVYYHEVFSKERLDKIDDDVKRYLEQAGKHTMAEYLWGQRTAARLRQDLADVFERVDVIVSPTCLTPPLPISETVATIKVRGQEVSARSLLIQSTWIASGAGLPALSVPCGLAQGHLPIGLQLMGRRLGESLLLRVGFAYEQATEWHLRHPNIG